MPVVSLNVRFEGECVAKTRLLLAIGFGGEFWRCPCPALPSTALTHRYRNLTPRLREANGGHRWRRTAEKLSKPPQVLCRVAPHPWRRSSHAAEAGRASGCASYEQTASRPSYARGVTAERLPCWQARGCDHAPPHRHHG